MMLQTGRPPTGRSTQQHCSPCRSTESTALKAALDEALHHAKDLRQAWEASHSQQPRATVDAGTQTDSPMEIAQPASAPRPQFRCAPGPSPLLLPETCRAGSIEARVQAACAELLTPGTHGRSSSATIRNHILSAQRRVGGVTACNGMGDNSGGSDSSTMQTPATRPGWLRSHQLETPVSSVTATAPFSAYHHGRNSSETGASVVATSTTSEACCTPEARAPRCHVPDDGAGFMSMPDDRQGPMAQPQGQRSDEVAMGVPMLEPMLEAFTPHTSAMRLRAAMQWMRLQLGAAAVAGGGSPRRVGRQRRYSDSSVSPALKILLGASSGGGTGVDGGGNVPGDDSACQREHEAAGGTDGVQRTLRSSSGADGEDDADVMSCINPLFERQQRRTDGGASARAQPPPWQAALPDDEEEVDSDDSGFGPYCSGASSALPFAAAAAVGSSHGIGGHRGAGGGITAGALVPAGLGPLRDISLGVNLAPVRRGMGKKAY